jgi:hypothetical protein
MCRRVEKKAALCLGTQFLSPLSAATLQETLVNEIEGFLPADQSLFQANGLSLSGGYNSSANLVCLHR